MAKKTPKLQEALKHVYENEAPVVFIDDSGIHKKTSNENSDLREKIFTAVVVPPSCASEVLRETFEISNELRRVCQQDLGAPEVREFHFCDIFHMKNEFKSIPLESRIGMFEFMATFIGYYPVEIITVRWSKKRNRRLVEDLKSLTHSKRLLQFNFENIEHSTFLLLVFKLRNHVKKKQWKTLPVVLCDEGLYKKSRVLISNMSLFEYFHQKAVFSVSSTEIPGIQIADFVAFLLSRHNLVRPRWQKNERLNQMDTMILRLVNKLHSKFIGLPKSLMARCGKDKDHATNAITIWQYGSNMDETRLNSRRRLDGSARFLGLAMKRGYKLAFTHTNKEGIGTSDVLPAAPDDFVIGALYRIPRSKIPRLRSVEGVSSGAYIEIDDFEVTVLDNNLGEETSKTLRVLTYLVKNKEGNPPTSSKYANHILKGIRDHRIGMEYFTKVRKIVLENNPSIENELINYDE